MTIRPHRLLHTTGCTRLMMIMIQLRSSVTLYSPLLALDPISAHSRCQPASQHLFTYSRSINRSFARHYRTGWRNNINLLGFFFFFCGRDGTPRHHHHTRPHSLLARTRIVVCCYPIYRAMTNSITIVCPFLHSTPLNSTTAMCSLVRWWSRVYCTF